MKRYLVILLAFCGLVGTTLAWDSSDFSNDTTKRLYDNGLTKYATMEEFHPNDYFTREQAAKFFSQFAVKVMGKTPNSSVSCNFEDINQADSTLKTDIITSCQLGIFQGSKGMFDPKRNLTIPEAVAVLIRVIHGKLDELNVENNRYENYIFRASVLNLLPTNLTVSSTPTRGLVGYMIKAAAAQTYPKTETVEGYIETYKICPIGEDVCQESEKWTFANLVTNGGTREIGEVKNNLFTIRGIPLSSKIQTALKLSSKNTPIKVSLTYESLEGDVNQLIDLKVISTSEGLGTLLEIDQDKYATLVRKIEKNGYTFLTYDPDSSRAIYDNNLSKRSSCNTYMTSDCINFITHGNSSIYMPLVTEGVPMIRIGSLRVITNSGAIYSYGGGEGNPGGQGVTLTSYYYNFADKTGIFAEYTIRTQCEQMGVQNNDPICLKWGKTEKIITYSRFVSTGQGNETIPYIADETNMTITTKSDGTMIVDNVPNLESVYYAIKDLNK